MTPTYRAHRRTFGVISMNSRAFTVLMLFYTLICASQPSIAHAQPEARCAGFSHNQDGKYWYDSQHYYYCGYQNPYIVAVRNRCLMESNDNRGANCSMHLLSNRVAGARCIALARCTPDAERADGEQVVWHARVAGDAGEAAHWLKHEMRQAGWQHCQIKLTWCVD
jgi:hypothetical protein